MGLSLIIGMGTLSICGVITENILHKLNKPKEAQLIGAIVVVNCATTIITALKSIK